MSNHRSLKYRQKKTVLVGIAILSLLIPTIGLTYTFAAADELQSCSLIASSGLANVSDIVGIGSEIDTRLMFELESSKCSFGELVTKINSGDLTGYSLDLVLASSQGLAQDIRLAQELSSAMEVVNKLSGPGRFGYLNQWW